MPKPRRVAVRLELDWPYKRHAATFAGTLRYAQEHGWQSTVDEFVEDTVARRGNALPYDGVIARASTKLASLAARLKLPVVNVWTSSPVWNRLPGVFPNYPAMGRMRAEHLLSRGLRRAAALTTDHDRGQVMEAKAFIDTLQEAGCQCNAETISLEAASSVNEWRKSERTIADWMDGWKLPIGVFVSVESHGRIVAQACRNRGWRVPEDVAIITGQNEETLCEGLRPTLSSIEIGYDRIGYEAALLLDRLMDGQAPPKEPILISPMGLVVRESTDFFAAEDSLIAAALTFIAANSHQQIGQDDVARAVATEIRTLQRRFQKHLNRSIASEIRRVRIERAKRELAQGGRSIKEIARDTGFGEAPRMYEVFQRELGVTPGQYRRERQVPTDERAP